MRDAGCGYAVRVGDVGAGAASGGGGGGGGCVELGASLAG
jgi:hypothetical protein